MEHFCSFVLRPVNETYKAHKTFSAQDPEILAIWQTGATGVTGVLNSSFHTKLEDRRTNNVENTDKDHSEILRWTLTS